MICEACGDAGEWSGCAELCPPCDEAIHARDTAPEVRMDQRQVAADVAATMAREVVLAEPRSAGLDVRGVLTALLSAASFSDDPGDLLTELEADAAKWEQRAQLPNVDASACVALADDARKAAERLRAALAAAELAA